MGIQKEYDSHILLQLHKYYTEDHNLYHVPSNFWTMAEIQIKLAKQNAQF